MGVAPFFVGGGKVACGCTTGGWDGGIVGGGARSV